MGCNVEKWVKVGNLQGGYSPVLFFKIDLTSTITMLIGEYTHSIDPKKRVALPSKFRGELGTRVVVTRGLDQCLFVYSLSVWESLAAKLGTLPIGESATRSFIRMLLSGAVDVEIDGQGRILIPDYLKDYAGLGKEATIVGLFNRVEVWNSDRWNSYRNASEKNTDEIAEQLGKLGVY